MIIDVNFHPYWHDIAPDVQKFHHGIWIFGIPLHNGLSDHWHQALPKQCMKGIHGIWLDWSVIIT